MHGTRSKRKQEQREREQQQREQQQQQQQQQQEDDDDPVVVDVKSTSTKCPIMQREMEPVGDWAPMCAPCGHVMSFYGATMYLNETPKPCPIAGCVNKTLVIGAMKRDKEFAKRLGEK